MKFRIGWDWEINKYMTNIEMLSFHYEHKRCLWITVLGVSLIWEVT